MKSALAILTLILSAALTCTLFDPAQLWMWILTVLITDFGHFFAILALGLFIFWLRIAWRQNFKSSSSIFFMVLSLGSVIVASAPVVSTIVLSSKWEAQLDTAFGQEHRPPHSLFSLGKIFLPTNSSISPITVTYLKDTSGNLDLDFYHARNTQLAPWVLVIHGGGWTSGERHQLPELNDVLANQGIAVADMSYRLAPDVHSPIPRDEARDAVRYLQAHTVELGLDPDRWVVLGRSAGGQIAEALAYQDPPKGLRGCIALYAPADLDFAYRNAKPHDILESKDLLHDYMGKNFDAPGEPYKAASPIFFVGPQSPPTLLLHGEHDELVWNVQSARLLERLHSAKVPSAFLSLPWETHGFDYFLNGPGGQTSTYAIEQFLNFAFSLNARSESP